MRTATILLLALLLAGCATNPYSRFYIDNTEGKGVLSHPKLIPPEGEPKVKRGIDAMQDSKEMARKGYALVGVSHFNAGAVSDRKALQHARKIKAEVVLLYSQYTNTVSGSMPMTLPDTTSSSTYMSGGAYGSGRYSSFSGSASTTTYGTRTTYVPYHVRRYDYTATFWVRHKALPFGIVPRELTDDEKREIRSNKGVAVFIVVRDTPAFLNDVLEGDIIKSIGGEEILDSRHCMQVLTANRGKEVDIHLLRDGEVVMKRIRLGDG